MEFLYTGVILNKMSFPTIKCRDLFSPFTILEYVREELYSNMSRFVSFFCKVVIKFTVLSTLLERHMLMSNVMCRYASETQGETNRNVKYVCVSKCFFSSIFEM